jgi:DNA-binding NarL/FixJ family response regulator
MTDRAIRILVVDDHPMVLEGLKATIGAEDDMEIAGSATTGSDAVHRFRETRPDVTVMDVTLGYGMSGIEAVQAIRREFPGARIIMLTVHRGEEKIYQALEAGAATYLLKETLREYLIDSIRQVYAGGSPIPPETAQKHVDRASRQPLTGRELEVLRLMAKGLRNKEIASRLSIGQQTVLSHIKSIFAKLGVNDRTAAVTIALQRGIIELAEE